MTFSPPLDAGIREIVETLCAAGIETYESCEGGPGHSYPEPTVRFHGDHSEGFRALAVAMQNCLRPIELRRVWTMLTGEPVGPTWELTFCKRDVKQGHTVADNTANHVVPMEIVNEAKK